MNSKQLQLVMAEYKRRGEAMEAQVVEKVNAYLDGYGQPDNNLRASYLVTDGIFDICEDDGVYFKYTMENGNEEDEVLFISDVWCKALAKATRLVLHKPDDPAHIKRAQGYLAVMEVLLDIQVNGL